MSNYSTDTDLEAYEPTVLTHLPPAVTSFDAQHTETKRVIDEIILRHLPDTLRSAVLSGERVLTETVDAADFKTVSIFYTLFMIFNWISSRRGDIYWHKARTYRALFEDAMASLTLDATTEVGGP